MQLRIRTTLACLALALAGAAPAQGQEHQHQQQDPAPPQQAPGDHAEHAAHAAGGASLFSTREASGTSLLPALTPMPGAHLRAGTWQLMVHGMAFGQFLHETGERGGRQAGSVNWGMLMARRPLAGGHLGLRGMLSLETWTIPGCAYPDLLASGEVCEDGTAIHDRQHPHDLFMELAAEYDRPVRGSWRWQVYAGVAGEPALGPVAFPHRTSAQPNLVAPVSHHWLDATHISFGVVTAGLYDRRWKLEASVFNGREPDSDRVDLDLAALDSWSGRLWWLPSDRLAFQVSFGRLEDAEPDHHSATPHHDALGHLDDAGRVDVKRSTASVTYHQPLAASRTWALTAAWGRNSERDGATDALLVESSLDDGRHAWFGRFEVVEKPASSLDLEGVASPLTVSKGQVGYVRYLQAWKGMSPGFGGSLSLGVVPGSAASAYGRRVNPGMAVFVTIRPPRHSM
jgi:hypothetical protein